jgi:[ribosomal protein S18]-alanine N-acetyltransferase
MNLKKQLVMMKINIYNPETKPGTEEKNEIVDFLHEHLEQYRDSKPDITKAIDYALKEYHSFGGFVMVARENSEIACAVVVNETGMKGYIPENILVYIATHKNHREKGLARNSCRIVLLMQMVTLPCMLNLRIPQNFFTTNWVLPINTWK